MNSNPAGWGVRATPRDDRGLGLEDINRVGDYGKVPEQGSIYGSMAPRGASIAASSGRNAPTPNVAAEASAA